MRAPLPPSSISRSTASSPAARGMSSRLCPRRSCLSGEYPEQPASASTGVNRRPISHHCPSEAGPDSSGTPQAPDPTVQARRIQPRPCRPATSVLPRPDRGPTDAVPMASWHSAHGGIPAADGNGSRASIDSSIIESIEHRVPRGRGQSPTAGGSRTQPAKRPTFRQSAVELAYHPRLAAANRLQRADSAASVLIPDDPR